METGVIIQIKAAILQIKKIIADTLKEYGSKEDKKTDGKPSKDNSER